MIGGAKASARRWGVLEADSQSETPNHSSRGISHALEQVCLEDYGGDVVAAVQAAIVRADVLQCPDCGSLHFDGRRTGGCRVCGCPTGELVPYREGE